MNPSDTALSAQLQANNRPTFSPPVLSNDTPPDSTISPATTTTPAAVLGDRRKRKIGHQKSKKPRKKQKKFIASDDEEDSEGSPTHSDSAHSSNSDHDSDNEIDGDEPLPHSMRRRSTRESASVAGVPRGTTSPVKLDGLQATVSVTSPARLPTSRPDEPSVQQAPNTPGQPPHTVISPVRSPQPTPPIATHDAVIVDEPDDEPIPHSMRRRSTRESASVAGVPRGITSPVKLNLLQATISVMSPACLPTAHPDEPSVRQAPNTPGQPPHTVISAVRSPQPTSPIATPHAIIMDDSWPDWFVKAHEHLTGSDLGPAFHGIISKYITFESLAGFSPEPRNAGFGSKNRPSQVAWWVGCGRKATPKITDIPAFAQQWWLWWKGLQPTWRNVANAQGPLISAHREVANGEGGWVDMERRGQNTFYTVLATLRWWGAALGDACREDEEWLSAGVDVEWVLSNLLERQVRTNCRVHIVITICRPSTSSSSKPPPADTRPKTASKRRR